MKNTYFGNYGIGAADYWLDKTQDDGKWVAKTHLELFIYIFITYNLLRKIKLQSPGTLNGCTWE